MGFVVDCLICLDCSCDLVLICFVVTLFSSLFVVLFWVIVGVLVAVFYCVRNLHLDWIRVVDLFDVCSGFTWGFRVFDLSLRGLGIVGL